MILYFLRFLFIAIIILWVIRLIVRLIVPSMVRNAFGQGTSQQSPPRDSYQKKEGTISILSTPKQDKKGNADKLGEFVEYEEVK